MTLIETIDRKIEFHELCGATGGLAHEALLALRVAVEALESLECSPTSYAVGCFKCKALADIQKIVGPR